MKINIMLPSIVGPLLFCIVMSLVNSIGNLIEGNSPLSTHVSVFFIGILIYSIFVFPIFNIVAWVSFWLLVKLKVDTYFSAVFLGWALAIAIFASLAPSELKTSDVPIFYLITSGLYGAVAAIIFRFLVYYKVDNEQS